MGIQQMFLGVGGAPPAIEATGGTKSTPGDGYVYHFITGGTFAVTSAGNGPDGIIDICLVGGGGGAGADLGGGGGGGGFRITTVDIATLGAGNYPCSVGSGGPSGGSSGPNPSRPRAQNGDPSYFTLTPTTKIEVGGGGGGGGMNGAGGDPVVPDYEWGYVGVPYPHPTASTPHPNTTVYPGSGGGAKAQRGPGGAGAGSNFNSSPGQQGRNYEDAGLKRGGGGGGAGETGFSPTSTGGQGGAGKQLPWALPTWGWGQNDDSNTPGGYGWFAGGGGGGSDPAEFCPNDRSGKAGGGRGGCPTTPYGSGAARTGSGGGARGNSSAGAGTGGSGVIMIRYPAG
tara:strand:- start:296 stop:1318 length:1023 start_codon:yes stop_codon:yes gene_type:complete